MMTLRARIFERFRSVVAVRPGEWGMAVLMFLLLSIVIGTFAVVKPVRSSLFLQQFGAKNLPYVYLATALLAGLVAAVHARLFRRYSVLKVKILTYLFFIATLLFFWRAFRHETPWLSAVFFLWVNVFTITLNTLFWIFANDYYSPREAKRLYGFINSGGTVGGIVGGFAVSLLVAQLGTENLLLWCAVALVICALLASAIYARGKERFSAHEYSYVSSRPDPHSAGGKAEATQGQDLFGTPYPKYIAAALGTSLVISTLVDYQFNSIVEQRYQQTDAMTAFFGSFSAWVNALTFVLQFFLTGPLLRRAGIGLALLILPVLMFTGSLIFSFYPLLASAVFLKIGDSSVRYSIEQSTRDVLYLPLPKLLMKRLKSFVDVFVQRLAKGLGSLVILGLTSWLALRFEVLSYFVVCLAAAWFFLAWLLRKEYVEELRRFLAKGNPRESDSRLVRRLDHTTTVELLHGLESSDDVRALSCVELLEGVQGVDLRPPLRRWVREGSSALQARALHLLAEAGDSTLVREAEQILKGGSQEAREEAVHYLCETHGQGRMQKMQHFLNLPDASLRAASLACMVNCGGAAAQRTGREILERMIRDVGPQAQESRILAARTLGHVRPPSALHSLLIPLLQDESGTVACAALRATERIMRRDLIPFVISHFGTPETSEAAHRALKAHGEEILGTLRDYLNDGEVPLDVRVQLPGVFAAVGSVRAAWDLTASLSQEERTLRHAIVKALNKLRKANPRLELPAEQLRPAILREVVEAYGFLRDLHLYTSRSPVGGDQDELRSVDMHRQRYQESVERIFRLLGLLLDSGDIFDAYRGLNSPRPELRTSAIELLENLLPVDLKAVILPLLDDSIPVEEKLRIGDSSKTRLLWQGRERQLEATRRGKGPGTIPLEKMGT